MWYNFYVTKIVIERNKMAINFEDFLSVEDRKSILNQRIQQFAVEAYQLNLNRKVADEASTVEIDKNLEMLGNAIVAYQEELNGLPE